MTKEEMKEVLDAALKQLKEILEQDRAARHVYLPGDLVSPYPGGAGEVTWTPTDVKWEIADTVSMQNTVTTNLAEDEDEGI